MKIVFWKTADLIPYARNPRKNDAVVDRMVSAIKEFGFRVPILAQADGTIVDGHLRLKAALALGLTEVPVILNDDLTATQVKAFRLLANRSVAWAEWDNELLKLELDEVLTADFPLELTGFDLEDMKLLELEEVKSNYGDRTASVLCPERPRRRMAGAQESLALSRHQEREGPRRWPSVRRLHSRINGPERHIHI